MIAVEVLENGDVEFRCDKGDWDKRVLAEYTTSVFWDVYVGRSLLEALGHFLETHKVADYDGEIPRI